MSIILFKYFQNNKNIKEVYFYIKDSLKLNKVINKNNDTKLTF